MNLMFRFFCTRSMMFCDSGSDSSPGPWYVSLMQLKDAPS
jgi:hypothetical protein